MTNHFRKVLVSQKMSTLLDTMEEHEGRNRFPLELPDWLLNNDCILDGGSDWNGRTSTNLDRTGLDHGLFPGFPAHSVCPTPPEIHNYLQLFFGQRHGYQKRREAETRLCWKTSSVDVAESTLCYANEAY